MKPFLFILITFLLMASTSLGQNYIGYNMEYIKKDFKSKKKVMKGPFGKKDEVNNYISFVSHDGERVIYYHFTERMVPAKKGGTEPDEICYKYVSINKCQSNLKCPELDKVVKSLNSHFTKKGDMKWHDTTKPKTHEWVIEKHEGHFEVHVNEIE